MKARNKQVPCTNASNCIGAGRATGAVARCSQWTCETASTDLKKRKSDLQVFPELSSLGTYHDSVVPRAVSHVTAVADLQGTHTPFRTYDPAEQRTQVAFTFVQPL